MKAQKNLISSIVLLKAINSITFFLLLASLNLLLLENGQTMVQAAQITTLFLSVTYILPLISGYLANKNIVPIKAFYLYSNFFASITMLLVFLTGMLSDPTLLALLCAPLQIQNIAITDLVNKITVNKDFLRRKIMLYNYGAVNFISIIAFATSFFLFKANHSHYLFLFLALAPLLNNLLYSRITKVISNNTKKDKTALLKFIILTAISFLVFWNLFQWHLFFRNLLLFSTLIGILYFVYLLIKQKNNIIMLKGILYLCYFSISVLFFSIMFLKPTVIFDLVKVVANIDNPQLVLAIEPICAVLFIGFINLLLRYLKSRKNNFYVTPLLFFMALSLLYLAVLLFTHSGLTIYNHVIFFVIYIAILTLGESLISPEGFTLAGRLLPKSMQVYSIGLWTTFVTLGYLFSGMLSDYILKGDIVQNSQHILSTISLYLPVIIACSLLLTLLLEWFISQEKKQALFSIQKSTQN
ncbi:MAG: hypothetical protein ACO2ZM_06745 [Francisellaceae bacterium]